MHTPENPQCHHNYTVELTPENGMLRARLAELHITGLGLTPSDAKADLLASLRKHLADYALHKSEYQRQPDFAAIQAYADELSAVNEAGQLIATLFGTI
jgi:hypothetical protein